MYNTQTDSFTLYSTYKYIYTELWNTRALDEERKIHCCTLLILSVYIFSSFLISPTWWIKLRSLTRQTNERGFIFSLPFSLLYQLYIHIKLPSAPPPPHNRPYTFPLYYSRRRFSARCLELISMKIKFSSNFSQHKQCQKLLRRWAMSLGVLRVSVEWMWMMGWVLSDARPSSGGRESPHTENRRLYWRCMMLEGSEGVCVMCNWLCCKTMRRWVAIIGFKGYQVGYCLYEMLIYVN